MFRDNLRVLLYHDEEQNHMMFFSFAVRVTVYRRVRMSFIFDAETYDIRLNNLGLTENDSADGILLGGRPQRLGGILIVSHTTL